MTVDAQFVDEPPAMKTDEVGLSSRRLLLADTHGVPPSLVVRNPLDPIRDRDISAHVNAFRSDRVS